MKYNRENLKTGIIESSVFLGEETDEYHLVIKPIINGSVCAQAENLLSAMDTFMEKHQLTKETLAFTRLFISDYTNQVKILQPTIESINRKYEGCAVSVVQQAPLDGAKINLWAHFIKGNKVSFKKTQEAEGLVMRKNGYSHVWNTQLNTVSAPCNSYEQTNLVFRNYDEQLKSINLNVANNCIRTWLYVRDVDTQYGDVVKARTKYFDEIGLTKDTHYIASTGINGSHSNVNVNLLMDAYAVGGLSEDQVDYIQAPEYLNPTNEYGVTFERGTNVKYGDRNHIFISGTASIDNKGAIVHENDIDGQIDRAFVNVKALLKSVDADLNDTAQLIVYLRDLSDLTITQQKLKTLVPGVPIVIVHAPVCRPGWLVEVECIAIKKTTNPEYHNF